VDFVGVGFVAVVEGGKEGRDEEDGVDVGDEVWFVVGVVGEDCLGVLGVYV
jgi:hypothetical protein